VICIQMFMWANMQCTPVILNWGTKSMLYIAIMRGSCDLGMLMYRRSMKSADSVQGGARRDVGV